MKASIVVLSLAATLLALPAAATEAFVVNVPVEFRNLEPAIVSVAIHCKVFAAQPNGTAKEFQPVKTTLLPIHNGSYGGASPVKVVFQVEDFAPPERAMLNQVNSTRCSFALVTATGELEMHGNETKSPMGHNLGAPFVWQTTGKFAK